MDVSGTPALMPRSHANAVLPGGIPAAIPTTRKKNEKTPMEFIAEVPPIEVEGTTAVCDGGGGALGHPVEYLQLNKVKSSEPETCKYCGLRFIQKRSGAHH